MSKNIVTNKIAFEVISWLMAFCAAALVLLPIYQSIGGQYPFYFSNTVYIVLFVVLTRYLFLLPHTFWAPRQVLKVVYIFAAVPLIFYLIQEHNTFQTYLDEQGSDALVGQLPYARRDGMFTYIHTEMTLFAVAAVVSAGALIFRMVYSAWSWRNKGIA